MNPPTKTLRAYKLFETRASRPGELFPLFIGRNKPTPIGEWVEADFIPTKGYAPRPGWHVGSMPQAPHLMRRDGSMPTDRVWAEVEIPADVDWTNEASGQPTRDLRARIPIGGYYRFPRPSNQGGEWLIAGAIRIIRLLSVEDVAAVIKSKRS